VPTLWPALLGFAGVLIGVVGTTLFAMYKGRIDRRIEFLRQQIQLLYGPLHFHMRNTVKIANYHGIIMQTYEEAFSPQKNPHVPINSPQYSEDLKNTITKANEYVELFQDNNAKAIAVIESHFWLAEPDDVPFFHELVLNAHRLKIEFDREKKSIVPWEIVTRLPPLPLYDVKLADHVDKKFYRKADELRQ
jgi:hypothetical protein